MIDCSDSNIEKVNIVRIHSFHFIVIFFKMLDRYFRLTGTYIRIEMCATHIVFLNHQISYRIALISEEYHDVLKSVCCRHFFVYLKLICLTCQYNEYIWFHTD